MYVRLYVYVCVYVMYVLLAVFVTVKMCDSGISYNTYLVHKLTNWSFQLECEKIWKFYTLSSYIVE
jgi:hypothetical protein